jgi:hypothetical protein
VLLNESLPALERAQRNGCANRGELLREFFGTLRADFGILCPFRSHIRDSAAKPESEERAYFSRFVGAPEEIRTPDPQIRSLVLYPAELRARRVVAIGSNAQWQEAAMASIDALSRRRGPQNELPAGVF